MKDSPALCLVGLLLAAAFAFRVSSCSGAILLAVFVFMLVALAKQK